MLDLYCQCEYLFTMQVLEYKYEYEYSHENEYESQNEYLYSEKNNCRIQRVYILLHYNY
jgi:hypothetical protein